MDGKTTEWRPGPTVCRCCLSEGCYKDISTEYFWMGKREVYAEMLSETLSVSISYSKSGAPNSHSRLICEPCISRLRDAAEFRRQVLECERMFIHHLDPGGSSTVTQAEVTNVETQDQEVKLENVKLEKGVSDDEFDDRTGFAEDDDDDDDDLDDQPLMNLASKIPKKEADSTELLNLLQNSEATLPIKRKSSSSSSSKQKQNVVMPRAKKMKIVKTKKEAKASSASSKPASKPVEKKKKELDMMLESRINAKILLKHTTVYPFKIPSNDMVCVYCGEGYPDPENYREHMKREHCQFNVKTAFAHTASYFEYLKVDCAELECRICAEPYVDLRSIAEHLVRAHNKTINLNAELGMLEFKLCQEKWVCAICDTKVPCLRALSRHTSLHYHKFTCETCGKSYISKESLSKHIVLSHTEGKMCLKCKRVFPNCKARRAHVEASKPCWPNTCMYCGDRFLSKKSKFEHMSTVHGERQKDSYTCSECGQIFDKWRKYRTHFVISHTQQSYQCPFCDIKFDTLKGLEGHKVIHTKEKSFPCTVCSKAFGRRKNLVQHMWIHSEHKRFECRTCNKQFNQRVSWKTHMKSYHPELVDF